MTQDTAILSDPPYRRGNVVRLLSGGLDMVVVEVTPIEIPPCWSCHLAWMDTRGQMQECRVGSDLLEFVRGDRT